MIKLNDVYASVQGEGSLTGVPMIVIRLMGCPVGCPFCDTKETWEARDHLRKDSIEAMLSERVGGLKDTWCEVKETDLVRYIAQQWSGVPEWILVTGGEPAEQRLVDLVDVLHMNKRRVQIETSGTATGHVGAGFDWVTVSPKVNMPGGRRIMPEALAVANEIKWVVGRSEDGCKLEEFLAEHKAVLPRGVSVSIQPLSQSVKATHLCVSLALSKGWRLSIQTHKYVGLR